MCLKSYIVWPKYCFCENLNDTLPSLPLCIHVRNKQLLASSNSIYTWRRWPKVVLNNLLLFFQDRIKIAVIHCSKLLAYSVLKRKLHCHQTQASFLLVPHLETKCLWFTDTIWAGSWDFGTYRIGDQRGLRRAAHPRSLTRVFAVRTHEIWNKNQKWDPLRALKTFIRRKMGHTT